MSTQALSQNWCAASVSGTAFAGMGGRVPTWRMVPGSSTESLALDVALQCQVPPDIVQRAAHLFKVTPVKTPDQHFVLWFCADAHPLSDGHLDVVELCVHVPFCKLMQLTFCLQKKQTQTYLHVITQLLQETVHCLHELSW